MNIKVCGITQLKQLEHLDAIGIEFAGLNFCEKSPRYVVGKISAEDVNDGDYEIKKVGVFVNEPIESVMRTVEKYGLDVVQLHGDETPAFCKRLCEETEVIKVFRIRPGADNIEKLLVKYDDACDYYLFDADASSSVDGDGGIGGGTGRQFDWEVLLKARIEKPFFLAGGIGLADVAKVKAFNHPDFFAVDINSRFEVSAGVKDLDLVKMFAHVLRN